MASNLPTNRRFRFEDFPDAGQWFANFLNSLNLFIDPVYQILDGGITYQNLVAPQIYTQTVTASATGTMSFNFANPLTIQPRAVMIGNIYVSGQPTNHPSSPSQVYWNLSENKIYVTNITNLTASTSYVITLVIL